MTRPDQDRRTSFRAHLQATVNLHIGEKVIAAGTTLRDISLDGIRISSREPMALNSACEVQITFTGPSSLLQIRCKGRILRQDAFGTAIKFSELDMDSYMYLKNMVLLDRSPDKS